MQHSGSAYYVLDYFQLPLPATTTTEATSDEEATDRPLNVPNENNYEL